MEFTNAHCPRFEPLLLGVSGRAGNVAPEHEIKSYAFVLL